MSDEQAGKPPSPVAPPIPALARQAPGVKGAREAPEGPTLQGGEVIGGKFKVTRYLGSSDGAVNYLCEDVRQPREVVVKLLDTSEATPQQLALLTEDVKRAAMLAQRPNLTGVYGMGQVGQGQTFVAMEFVDGSSLSRLIARKRELNKSISLRDVFTVLTLLCAALDGVHGQRAAHGVLTPYNVYVTRRGQLKLANLAFGSWAARMLHPSGKGPYQDSIYVAPELHRDPTALTPAADLYSLGMVAVEMLKPDGLPADRAQASRAVSQVLASYPPRLTQLLLSMLDTDPQQRPRSIDRLRKAFEEIARELGVDLSAMPSGDELPISPVLRATVKSGPAQKAPEEDLFNLPELTGDHASLTGTFAAFMDDEDDGRYLVQKSGLDYGPFTQEQVIEQLQADEIDEHTQVLDRLTQERVALIEMDVFRAKVEAHIPVREERLRREAAARAELQRKVKKGGTAVFVVGIAVGLVVLAGMLIIVALQPDPKPLPMEQAFAAMDYKLLPPPKDFAPVAVNQDLIKNIFDPKASEEEIAKQLKKIKRKPAASRKPAGAGAGDDENITEVDLSAGGSDKILSDNEIYEVIMQDFPSLRRCVQQEMSSNPNFKGLSVQFFIRPTGTTGGVKIKESGLGDRPVGRCMVSRFRLMKFPEHGGFNRGVTFPLMVQ